MRKISISLVCLLVFTALFSSAVWAVDVDRGPIWRPSSPVYEEIGAAGLYQSLLKLPFVASFASIGAHPDDDDSALLAYVSRGLMARTANVCMTRGDGGQNAIGPELYQGLGVIRTEELLAARRIDGAEQYFTRAFDFGFSKSIEDTLNLWGEELVLEDLVRFIRTYRPDVILDHHADETAKITGHGHHQATGYLVPLAIELAADPTAFPHLLEEGLLPWDTPKVYYRYRVLAGAGEEVTLEVDRGDYNPILGRSYREIGAESRSYHRTQTMGALQEPGKSPAQFRLVRSKVGYGDEEKSFFDGIDTTIAGIARHAGEEIWKVPLLEVELLAAQKHIERAVASFDPLVPETIVPSLVSALGTLRDVKGNVLNSSLSDLKKDYIVFQLDRKIAETEQTIIKAAGLMLTVFSESDVYIPGESVTASLNLFNRGNIPVEVKEIGLYSGDNSLTIKKNVNLAYNDKLSENVRFIIPENTPKSRVFWELEPGIIGQQGKLLVNEDDYHLVNEPFRPYPVNGFAVVNIGDQDITLTRPSQYRIHDTVTGEFRNATAVVSPISVQMNPEKQVLIQSAENQTIKFSVRVMNNDPEGGRVQVKLNVPELMQVDPVEQMVEFSGKGQAEIVDFYVTVPTGISDGEYEVYASATANGVVYTEGYQVIEYPHVERHHLYSPAKSTIVMFEMEMERDLTIGYIMGPDDGIPPALAQVGIHVIMLDEGTLDTVDLSQFDTIVTARMAYEFRPDLVANNERLLRWVAEGGVLVVQYNRYPWNNLQVSPYPTLIRRPHDRVTQQDAEITILEPSHPIFNYPNKITNEDFAGWHQERGLYFLGEWDDRYVPLMACSDPGEDLQKGGMLWTPYGKGGWLYTGYAFFRQIPGGVPGGYRLFANMLSLPAYLK